MALRHRERAVEGVQFHPESVLTQGGHRLLANFLGVEPPEGLTEVGAAARSGDERRSTAVSRSSAWAGRRDNR
jgi:para-aminobenzoate synthetase component 2